MHSETEKKPTTWQANPDLLGAGPDNMQQVNEYFKLYRFETQEALDGLEENIVRALRVHRRWNLTLSALAGLLCIVVVVLALRMYKTPTNLPKANVAPKPAIAAGPDQTTTATNILPASGATSTKSPNSVPANPETARPSSLIAPDHAEKIIKLRSEYALTYFKRGTFDRLAVKYVHPEKGVHFFPLGLKATGQAFMPKSFANLMFNPVNYKWGKAADFDAPPVEAKFVQYYKTYIYDEDYLTATSPHFNKITFPGKFGLSAAAIARKFPGCIFTEYRKNGKSLILVFEPFKGPGVWYLVGVIHSS